ncbi:MAG: SRPBCC family protein [Cyclobacteriaceae bacterium]|nr:SRPBCC family protein [Cyclobacteriaceae bacterium]
MKTKLETKIIAEPGRMDVSIVREFHAPRELVFNAHADPELIRQWLGPKKYDVNIHHYNSKSGGSYRYSVVDKNGKTVASFNGAIHEVTAPERIIQTFEFEGLPERGHVTLDCTTFESLPGNRTRVTVHSVCRSQADRDAMMASGMESGINDGYDKLDELLTKL